ncbi:MAG: type VI secretion system amidase effector protein Tae4 [Elusimicrobia bacterium]|nr:type VI secretion system amidase effector protein Tae4 [Elusimicrobiota bacterium]
MTLAALLFALVLARPADARLDPDSPVDDMGRAAPDASLRDDTLACLILSDEACAAGANATKLITRDARTTPTAAPVFGVGGNFERLAKAYPHGDVEQVKAMIGRSGEGWIVNTCAIRVTYAMNHSGVPQFRIDRAFLGEARKINYISDKAGKDHAYVYRVDEFANYMLKKYGKPQVWATKGDNFRTAVYGRKGVILFVVSGWNDATGHFDLWDGEKAAHQEFFDKASDVFLWQ